MADSSAGPLYGTPPVSAEGLLLARYAAHRDPRLLEALVVRYRPLALNLARRYAAPERPMDDLGQVACLGLIKALQRFDPGRGCAFATFAVPTILGELRRFCRDVSWSLHVPRGMQERILAVRRAGDTVTAARGHTATVAEVAEALGWHCETVVEALAAHSATRSTVSLDTQVGDAADPCRLLELLGDVDPGFELAESLAALEESVGALTRNERRVLRLRFAEDLGCNEVASRLGLPETQVSRLLASALRTLRRELGAPDGDEPRPAAPRAPRPMRRRHAPVAGLAGSAA